MILGSHKNVYNKRLTKHIYIYILTEIEYYQEKKNIFKKV